MKSALFLLALSLATAACKATETFPAIGDTLASPVDVAVSDDGAHFFVLNADFDRTFNQGSLVVLDADGAKVKTVLTPRMGRNIFLAGNDMIVTYDTRDDGEGPMAQLYDVTNATDPVLKKQWDLVCSPYGGVMTKGYKHFAITCMFGEVYVGTLKDDRAQSDIKLVRDFGSAHRALYLDTKRELLFGFPTDEKQNVRNDAVLKDETSWDADANEVLGPNGEKTPNEIPDDMERSKRLQSDKTRRRQFQYFVYDIAAERDAATECVVTETETCVFPYRGASARVDNELRWIYFKLNNFDGTPDPSAEVGNPNYKYYRTNFWEARPDPTDTDVFYLSQRGPPGDSPHANQIVRATIIDDPRSAQADGKPIATERFMVFDRVYGFKGQGVNADGVDNFKFHYPGDFEIKDVQGQKLLVVNHFRDLVSWVNDDRYFSIGAQVVDDLTWFTEVSGSLSASDLTTYYQVALNQSGRAVSCSFYGNAVMLLQITPGIGVEVVKRIQ